MSTPIIYLIILMVMFMTVMLLSTPRCDLFYRHTFGGCLSILLLYLVLHLLVSSNRFTKVVYRIQPDHAGIKRDTIQSNDNRQPNFNTGKTTSKPKNSVEIKRKKHQSPDFQQPMLRICAVRMRGRNKGGRKKKAAKQCTIK